MTTIADLKHPTFPLVSGGRVVALNTGALIDPESGAMLQALYSRSPDTVDKHLSVIVDKGPEHFLQTYYVGYGHKSIGDCGSGTLFIEGVSMLAAKAIQDWPLYSGQEVSTRYVDFAVQPFMDPVATHESEGILETWRSFYSENFAALVADLKRRYPMQADENEKIYQKAINARAFDILRGFLPAGAKTNLAWHGNLRQFSDKLQWLLVHPLSEVRDIAHAIQETLHELFPSSFSRKIYEQTRAYQRWYMRTPYHLDAPVGIEDIHLAHNGVDEQLLFEEYAEVLSGRPPKTELPTQINECGTVRFEGNIDFGSFRDVQRHRAVVQRMPLLRINVFEEWYLNELPVELRQKAHELLDTQASAISGLACSDVERQYYIPMGYKVPIRISGGIASLVYLVELRATRHVHPTLRKRARAIGHILTSTFGNGLSLHLDADPDRFDIKRGEHDITKRSA